MNWVTVATYTYATEAHLLRMRLETEGLHPQLKDEHTVTQDPLLSHALGGIKVQVPAAEEAHARAIVQAVADLPHTTDDNIPLSCPKCGSYNLEPGYVKLRGLAGFLQIVVMFLLMIFPFYQPRAYRCSSCDTLTERRQLHAGNDDVLGANAQPS